MKIYIGADMEGVSGVVASEHVTATHPEYARFRHLMTAEINAAVAGAVAAGASEVTVNDSHGYGTNILIEELHPAARLITGRGKPLSMVEGISADFTAALFIGYHERASSRGILNHTYSSRTVRSVRINGREIGETGINAAVAGAFGVPVAMVSGDAFVADEAKAWLGPIETAVVKVPHGRNAADCLSPEAARALIRDTAERAVRNAAAGQYQPLRLATPTTFEITWLVSQSAESSMMLPGVERVDDTTVRFTFPDLVAAYRCFDAALSLA